MAAESSPAGAAERSSAPACGHLTPGRVMTRMDEVEPIRIQPDTRHAGRTKEQARNMGTKRGQSWPILVPRLFLAEKSGCENRL